MYIICGTGEECGLHLVGRAGIRDFDLVPISAVLPDRVFEHYQRLETMVRKQRLPFEVLPMEFRLRPAADDEEAVALVDLREMHRQRSIAGKVTVTNLTIAKVREPRACAFCVTVTNGVQPETARSVDQIDPRANRELQFDHDAFQPQVIEGGKTSWVWRDLW